MQFRLADILFTNLDPMAGVFALLTGGWLYVRVGAGVISYPASRVSDVRWQSDGGNRLSFSVGEPSLARG